MRVRVGATGRIEVKVRVRVVVLRPPSVTLVHLAGISSAAGAVPGRMRTRVKVWLKVRLKHYS
mgnify:CR=1 FL=1